jgi:N-succinyldiaminopimelate aminotransferase
MNPQLTHLHPYPFEKLRSLLSQCHQPNPQETIALSVGEPQHALPGFVSPVLQSTWQSLNKYPKSKGSAALRECIARWQTKRADLQPSSLDPEAQVLPASGTREALFSFAQAMLDPTLAQSKVGMPNPFYQIYEGAAIMAGCEPFYINCLPECAYQPDFNAVTPEQWDALQLLYICNPHNPTGASFSLETLCMLVEKAQHHNFLLAADECYSEIYRNPSAPPISLLAACKHLGLDRFEKCIVFNSLSKRSNLAGLRSGFVAGDADLLTHYARYRTYHGCTLSPVADAVSVAAWSDETHVSENRALYQRKLDTAHALLTDLTPLPDPAGGFCLWIPTPVDDHAFTQSLYEAENVLVLPGQFLARSAHGINPGQSHIRVALVAEQSTCERGIQKIAQHIARLQNN